MSLKISDVDDPPSHFGRGASNIPPLIANSRPRIDDRPSILGGRPIKFLSISLTHLDLTELEGGGDDIVTCMAPPLAHTLYRPIE